MTSIQNVVNQASETLLHSVSAAGTGYMFAGGVLSLSPVHAAVISAISVLVSKVTNPVFQMCFGGPDANGSSLFLGNVLNITVSVAATIAIANAIGYSISVPAFLYLNAVAVGTFVLVNLGILAASAEVISIEATFSR